MFPKPPQGAALRSYPHGSPLSPVKDPLPAPIQPALMQAPAPQAPQPEQPQAVPALQQAQPSALQIRPASFKPFDKENRSRSLLAIGTGLLSSNDFFKGVGQAGQNLEGVRDEYRAKHTPTTQIGGPDNSFEVTYDPQTGQRSYKPIDEFTQYQADKFSREHAPKPEDVIKVRGNTMAAIMKLPEGLRQQAYSDYLADSKRLGFDFGLPAEFNPDVASSMANQALGVNGLTANELADARLRQSGENAQARLGLARQSASRADARLGLARAAASRAEIKAKAPPSKRGSKGNNDLDYLR